jgi:hypothetical protein
MPSGEPPRGWRFMVDDGTDRMQPLYRFFADGGTATVAVRR